MIVASALLGWQPLQSWHSSGVARRGGEPLLVATSSSSKLSELLELCALTDRGQRGSTQERLRMAALVREFETDAPEASVSQLNGRWRLVGSSEAGAYRSSPFFWAFKQCTRGLTTPVGIPSSNVQPGDSWAAAVYAITDSIPFYDVGSVTQVIEGVCDDDLGCELPPDAFQKANGPDDGAQTEEEPSEGTSDKVQLMMAGQPKLTSQVSIQINRLFGLPGMSSMMTTTASIDSAQKGRSRGEVELTLVVGETEARDNSVLAMLPAFAELPAFPSGSAMELVKKGSSRIKYRTTYLTDSMRISRYATEVDENGQVDDSAFFIYLRENLL